MISTLVVVYAVVAVFVTRKLGQEDNGGNHWIVSAVIGAFWLPIVIAVTAIIAALRLFGPKSQSVKGGW